MASFQLHVEPRLDHRRQLTVTRRDMYPDEAWSTTPRLVEHVVRFGLDSWIQAVRYWTVDTWSALHLMRGDEPTSANISLPDDAEVHALHIEGAPDALKVKDYPYAGRVTWRITQ